MNSNKSVLQIVMIFITFIIYVINNVKWLPLCTLSMLTDIFRYFVANSFCTHHELRKLGMMGEGFLHFFFLTD